ncbi:MAG: AmmeMemoRadiSam system protein A [Chloroflexi bacterium]|nr:AmmeMemoRadiSam system protein A [Chloroflexota bacterium]
MTNHISPEMGQILIKTVRQTLEIRLKVEKIDLLDLEGIPSELNEQGASFITLTKQSQLRGCVGSIEATQPLIQDVQERAIGAGFEDPRFPPITEAELPEIRIEVSLLTKPEPLDYQSPDELVKKLRPGIDGVILKHQYRRATFLPQVWEQLPKTEIFLDRLCQKMGLDPAAWRTIQMQVEVYQVVKFIEDESPS